MLTENPYNVNLLLLMVPVLLLQYVVSVNLLNTSTQCAMTV
jgi:hypothetical protein